MSKGKKSTKTTIAGWLAVVSAGLTLAVSVLKGNGIDPDIANSLISTLLGVLGISAGGGLIAARDNDVTSEDAGAK